MTNDITVFIVTEGRYSDYRIVGVCSSYERAEHLCEITRMRGGSWHSDTNIERWDVDEEVALAESSGMATFVSQWHSSSSSDAPPDLELHEYDYREEFPPPFKGDTILHMSDTICLVASSSRWGREFRLYVKADNLDKAAKIARDFWAEVQATAVGINT